MKTKLRRRKAGKAALLIMFLIISVAFLFVLPSRLFDNPRSTVLYASDGRLLSAVIASDGQWRFPHREQVPEKFELAVLTFEDRHFYQHNGIFLPSVVRAVFQNISERSVVSGASTISMQVIRMSRDNPPRNLKEKLFEMFCALRLETRYSKEEILSLYASNAPFGGNVVGIDAAAWRYFGRTPEELSWAESATLAVLPNAPALIFPGKNQTKLLERRNSLLQEMYHSGYFDQETLELSLLEPLPGKPHPLPQDAMHLLNFLMRRNGKGDRYYTTIDPSLQDHVTNQLNTWCQHLDASNVHNAAALVIDVKNNRILAYAGNRTDIHGKFGAQVDVIQSRRSTGSILKPFLYAAMLQDGRILPHTLIEDTPMEFDGFSPKNFSELHDGAVPASSALSRSLNIPSVVMLRDYGYPRFYHLLKKIGLSHLDKPSDHYGLSLILGGAEASLWDLANAYSGMSKTLSAGPQRNGSNPLDAYEPAHLLSTDPSQTESTGDEFLYLDAGSVWCTFQSLLEVNRPETELGWEAYHSSSPIAWKTGTSFGNRDAWAIGTTPEYVVAVWVGNADGEGRPEITGTTAAAPLMFNIYAALGSRSWFQTPHDDLRPVTVCQQSGMQAGQWCTDIREERVPFAGINTPPCSYHQPVQVNEAGLRISAECAHQYTVHTIPWFVMPPVQAYYYKSRHPEYKPLPAYAPDCIPNDHSPIGLISPKSGSPVYLPVNQSGQLEKLLLEATHTSPDAVLFFHLDQTYLGSTKGIHQLEIRPDPGQHTLTIEDEQGNRLVRTFRFIGRKD